MLPSIWRDNSIFGENLFDDWFGFPTERDFRNIEKKIYGKNAAHVMKTDVAEHDDHYEIAIDLPGFKKEDVTIDLENGYLTISAAKGVDKDENDKHGKLIRQERYSGAMQRSFYVGENITEEDVKAKYEDGVLRVDLPKKEARKVPEKKQILIG